MVNATDRNLNITFETGQTIAIYASSFSSTAYCPQHDEPAVCEIELTMSASPVIDIETNTTYFIATTTGTWMPYEDYVQGNSSVDRSGHIGDNVDIEGATNSSSIAGNATLADLSLLDAPQWNIDLLCNSPVGGDCGASYSLYTSASFHINNGETYYVANS